MGIVNDTARDAIILCYHPRSHSSQELVAIFDDLAEELKTVPGVLVGRMNVLENDYHDAYAIPGSVDPVRTKRSKTSTHPLLGSCTHHREREAIHRRARGCVIGWLRAIEPDS